MKTKYERILLFSVTKKDFNINYFSGKGPGGQNRNKVKNCVRLQHKASGITAIGQRERNQKANLKAAFMAIYRNPKFQLWLKLETSKITEELDRDEAEIQHNVEKAMKPKNLKIEYLKVN